MTPGFLDYLREARGITLRCPCCHWYFQLTEGRIDTGRKLGAFEAAESKLALRAERLEDFEKRQEIRRERLQEKAREKGRREARAKLKVFTGAFTRLGINPGDLRPIHDPIRFVDFSGLAAKDVRQVRLVADHPRSKREEGIQASLAKAVARRRIGWQVIRCMADGTARVENSVEPRKALRAAS